MKTEQRIYSKTSGWQPIVASVDSEKAQLVFLFGDRDLLKEASLIDEIRSFYPNSQLVGCSTAGEICGTEVMVNSIVCTAVEFKDVQIVVRSEEIKNSANSADLGQKLASKLDQNGLKHAFVFSEALGVNGSQLTQGLNDTFGR